jgi:speckle-type POZ protein
MSTNDDSLTIHCQLTITEEAYTSVGVKGKIVMPPSSIASHLENLLVSEHGSDVKFLVEECDFHAHGAVIAARSPALYQMVTEQANEDNHIIRVDDMKHAVFRSVLHFIYTDKMPSMDNLAHPTEDLLVAACRFGLEGMKIICENFLAEYISKENVLNTLKLAQRHHCLKLKNYCLEFIALPHVTRHLLKTISLD